MSHNISYAIIGDATKKSKFGPPIKIIYATPSIKEGTGFEVEECLDRSTFDFLHELDVSNAYLAYKEQRLKQTIASVFYTRIRLKTGQSVYLECTISFCYTWVVGTCRVIDSINIVDFWSRNALAEAIYLIDEAGVTRIEEKMVYRRNSEFHSSIIYQDPFDSANLKLEMRAAFLLDHYTHRCDILFCTDSVKELFGLCPEDMVGTSFFSHIHEDDLAEVHEEIEDLKSEASIIKMYFTITCPVGNIDVEMYGIHTRDALAIIIREDTSFKSFSEIH
ncbi:hypothetical protein K7432_009490 [Basidiobolus ranarum]|uniref:PAS domain-containing protein n=1 Tax=Basidiobolus ranarum TaxID=34480 RepID=A0ABR2WQ47_9FUNG